MREETHSLTTWSNVHCTKYMTKLLNVQFFTVSQNPLVHIFAVYQVKALVAKVQYMLSSQKQDDGGGIDI